MGRNNFMVCKHVLIKLFAPKILYIDWGMGCFSSSLSPKKEKIFPSGGHRELKVFHNSSTISKSSSTISKSKTWSISLPLFIAWNRSEFIFFKFCTINFSVWAWLKVKNLIFKILVYACLNKISLILWRPINKYFWSYNLNLLINY